LLRLDARHPPVCTHGVRLEKTPSAHDSASCRRLRLSDLLGPFFETVPNGNPCTAVSPNSYSGPAGMRPISASSSTTKVGRCGKKRLTQGALLTVLKHTQQRWTRIFIVMPSLTLPPKPMPKAAIANLLSNTPASLSGFHGDLWEDADLKPAHAQPFLDGASSALPTEGEASKRCQSVPIRANPLTG
jgi:hypothetical protein